MKSFIISMIEAHSSRLIILMSFIALGLSFGITQIEQQYSQKAWFRTGDPHLEKYEKFKKEYGTDKNLILILSFKDDIFKEKNMSRIYEITESIWTLPNFIKVDSLTNFSHTFAEGDDINIEPFIKDPLDKKWTLNYLDQRKIASRDIKAFDNFFISKDKKTAIIYTALKQLDGMGRQISRDAIASLKSNIVEKYQTDDLKIMLSGSSAFGPAFEEQSVADLTKIIPLAFLILIIVLYIILRSAVTTLIALGIISITLLSSLGAQGWLGIRIDLITGLCPLIILAISVADIVHILMGFIDSAKDGKKPSIAMSLKKNLYPTFLTSVTTTFGFLSFMTADLAPIVDMGIVSAIGICLAWIFSVFLLCPLLNLIPIDNSVLVRKRIRGFNTDILHSFIVNNSRKIVGLVFLLTCGAIFLSQKNTVDTNVQNYFNKSTDMRKINDFFAKEIGGLNAIELIVDSGKDGGILAIDFMSKLDLFLEEVKLLGGVTKVHSLLDQIKEVNRVMNGGGPEYFTVPDSREKAAQELFFLDMSLPPSKSIYKSISSDKSKVRVTVFWRRTSSLAIVEGRSELESLLKRHGLKGYVTGGVPLNAALDGYIITSFVKSMLAAITLISILMMFVFKSFWFGLFSMIPNIIVPSFGAAVLYMAGRQFDAASILIFSICLGIAIDDTIYFLTNLKSSMDDNLSVEETVGRVLQQAGATLSYTTIILVCVFGLFYFGSFVPNENFAIATTVILSSALALDLIFLPALILFIEKNKFIPFSFSNFKPSETV